MESRQNQNINIVQIRYYWPDGPVLMNDVFVRGGQWRMTFFPLPKSIVGNAL